MGLYDQVKIAPSLIPVEETEKMRLKESCQGGFQTKSLMNVLSLVEITQSGRLRRALSFWEKPEAIVPDSDSPADRSSEKEWIELGDFTGEIRFYDRIDSEHYEFCALFAQGELLKIVKIAP